MRILLSLIFSCFALFSAAQPQALPTENYLTGAVPMKNGQVVFEQRFPVQHSNKQQIYDRLKSFTQQLIDVKEKHPNSRITELSPESGIVAASVEEYIWFKRNAFVWDRALMRYHLVFQATDEGFTATMRHIRYNYEGQNEAGIDTEYKAEDWITDQEALSHNGMKLTRVAGKKFRVRTIDRKNVIFSAAAKVVTQP